MKKLLLVLVAALGFGADAVANPRIYWQTPDLVYHYLDFPVEFSRILYHHSAQPDKAETAGNVQTRSEIRSRDLVTVEIARFDYDEAFEDAAIAFWSWAATGRPFVVEVEADHGQSWQVLLANVYVGYAQMDVGISFAQPFISGRQLVIYPAQAQDDPHKRSIVTITNIQEFPIFTQQWRIDFQPQLTRDYAAGAIVRPAHTYLNCAALSNADPLRRMPGNKLSFSLRFTTNMTGFSTP